jgi:hypothetical protein
MLVFFEEKLGQFPGPCSRALCQMRTLSSTFFTMLSRTVVFVFAILAIANCGFAQRSDAPAGPARPGPRHRDSLADLPG